MQECKTRTVRGAARAKISVLAGLVYVRMVRTPVAARRRRPSADQMHLVYVRMVRTPPSPVGGSDAHGAAVVIDGPRAHAACPV
jgi:hypothetical protein